MVGKRLGRARADVRLSWYSLDRYRASCSTFRGPVVRDEADGCRDLTARGKEEADARGRTFAAAQEAPDVTSDRGCAAGTSYHIVDVGGAIRGAAR